MKKKKRVIKFLKGATLFCSALLLCSGLLFSEEASNSWDREFADGLFLRGMYDAAIKEYEKISKQSKDNEERLLVDFKIAEAYFKKNDFDKSRFAFNEFIKKYRVGKPKEIAKFYLAMISYMNSDFKDAVNRFEQLRVKPLPGKYKAMFYYYQGISLKEEGRPMDAIQSLEKVQDLEQIQLRPLALEAMSGIYKEMGNIDLANNNLETLIADYPENTSTAEIYLSLGRNYFEAGDFQSSLENFKKANEKNTDPKNRLKIDYGLIKNYFQLGEVDNTIDFAERILKTSLDDTIQIEIEYLLAASLFQKEDYKKAATQLETLIKKKPRSSFTEEIYLQAIWAFFELKNKTKFNTYFKAFEEKFPESLLRSECHFLRGEFLFEEEKFEDALKNYESALGINVVFRYADYARFKKIFSLKSLGRQDEAFSGIQVFLNDFPNSSYLENILLEGISLGEELGKKEVILQYCSEYIAKFIDGDSLERVFMLQIQIQFELKRLHEMHYSLGQFMTTFPQSERLREAYYYMGWHYQQNENYPDSIKFFQKSLNTKDNTKLFSDDEIKLQLGLSFYLNKQHAEADQSLTELLKGNALHLIPLDMKLWMGDYKAEEENFEEAISLYKKLLKETSGQNLERVTYKIAEWNFKQKKWKEALQHYEQMVQKFPEGELLYFSKLGVAECQLELKNHEKAKVIFEELKKIDVPFIKARAHSGLGDIYHAAGNLKEAARSYMFVGILFEDPMVPQVMFKALKVKLELKEKGDAAKILAELKERYPDSPWTKDAEGILAKKSKK